MAFYTFFSLVIFSSFIIVYSLILGFNLFVDRADYFIKTPWDVFKNGIIFVPLVLFLCMIFLWRFLRRDNIFYVPGFIVFLEETLLLVDPANFIIFLTVFFFF